MAALNRVIEEVAYKQVEDLIVHLELLSEQIIKTSQDAQKNKVSFAAPAKSNDDLNKKLAESEAAVKKLQGQYKELQKTYGDLTKKVNDYTTAKKNNTVALTNNSISQSQLLKNVKEEEVLTSSLTTYIQKLSVERIRASRTVADYNAMIQMGTVLTEEQNAELAQATAQFTKYDNAIKAGKKSIGDAREYVGQYERANIGLSNSVNQIARELPSATFGFQTFALAVSNNVPIFVDEIQKATAANKELTAQGKDTTSVFKQVGSALLSFNTIMSIGLLLVSLYGKEIAKWAKELLGGSEALDEINKRQKEFNKSKLEGSKDAQTEILELNKYLKVAKNVKLSDEERQIALKKLRSEYPFYFKNLTDAQILNGQYGNSVKEVTKALEIQKEVERKSKLNVENRQKVIDLEAQLDLAKQLERARKSEYDQISKISGINPDVQNRVFNKYNDALKERKQIESDLDATSKVAAANDKVIYDLKGKIIGLEYSDTDAKDKNTKSIKLNTKAREDYLASEYELIHLRLTNVANANKAVLEDEASGYDLRSMAAEQYYGNLVDLANMEAKEELRVLKFATEEKLRTTANEYLNQKEQLDNWLKDGKISQEKYNTGLKNAEADLQYDRSGILEEATNKQNIIYENQAQKLIEANKATVGQLAKIWDEINFGKANIEIGNVDLTNIQKLGEVLKGIGKDMTIEEIQRKLQEVSRIARDNQNDINSREAQLALDRAERAKVRLESEIRINGVANGLNEEQIQNQLNNNKALQDADQDIINAKKKVEEADNATTQAQIDNQLKLLEETKKVNDAMYEGKMELYGSIKDLAGQLFENQINEYDREIEKSNERYDVLIDNAERGSAQEIALQEQKQAAEEKLQRKKVEAQRKQAIFNKLLAITDIAIKLQQEIANNNATFPFPANQAINAFSIASAAVRVGTVLATPLPQYKGGRGFGKEEDAWVDDGEVPEVIQRENGRIEIGSGKPRIVHLKPKDIVHKSVEDFQKSKFAIENAAIMASFANQAEQLQRFDYYLGQNLKGLPEKMEKSIENGFKKVRIINNVDAPIIDIDQINYRNRGFNA